MLAGSRFRVNSRNAETAIDEVQRAQGDIICLLTSALVVGAGAAQGALDAGNMMNLPGAASLRIGATTLDEYRQYIEKDSALDHVSHLFM
jgi:ATP-dependent Clp protease ATP-binding subunit ClpB